jgi:tetratricopeptide (TPR) repeat protein
MNPRAFLSHSSADKDFVSAVAGRLGRHKIVFDVMHFDAGEELLNEMEKYVNSSEIFVFFASPKSLESYWVKFEVDLARLARIKGTLARSLTYVISNKVKISEIPKWLQASRIIPMPGVGQVVRDIDSQLMKSVPPSGQVPFVGRHKLIETFQFQLSQGQSRKVFSFSGLENVGRRSYAKKVLEENFGLRPGPTLEVDTFMGLKDTYAQLLVDARAFNPAGLKSEIIAFESLSPTEQLEEVAAQLVRATGHNEYPILFDQQGLTDKSGRFDAQYLGVIEKAMNSADVKHLVTIHRVRPRYEETFLDKMALHQFVPPLNDTEATALLRRLLTVNKSPFQEHQLQKCVELCDGYPPAIFFAATYIASYGIEVLLNNKDELSSLKRKAFAIFLQKLGLNAVDKLILRYMSREGGLTFDVLGVALGMNGKELGESLQRLIDLSLLTFEPPHYLIAWPLRDSIERLWGAISSHEYSQIAKRLIKWTNGDKPLPDIETINATLAAQLKSGARIEEIEDSDLLILPSTVLRLCERAYHERQYEKAAKLADIALKLTRGAGQQLKAYAIKAKAMVNMQQWDRAETAVAILDDRKARDRFAIRGFMLRKRRKYREALAQYLRSIDTGFAQNWVQRDCADCLVRLDQFSEALKHIEIVLQRDSDNPWVLDLWARCLDDLKRDADFWIALQDLKACDAQNRFWRHREAAFLAKRGDHKRAMSLAESACSVPSAPFESFANYADIAIEVKNFPLAKGVLETISEKFGRFRPDVQAGLWCKYFVRQNQWQEAEAQWDTMEQKDLPVHRALRLRILELKAEDKSLDLLARQEAKAQAKIIAADPELKAGDLLRILEAEDGAADDNV